MGLNNPRYPYTTASRCVLDPQRQAMKALILPKDFFHNVPKYVGFLYVSVSSCLCDLYPYGLSNFLDFLSIFRFFPKKPMLGEISQSLGLWNPISLSQDSNSSPKLYLVSSLVCTYQPTVLFFFLKSSFLD